MDKPEGQPPTLWGSGGDGGTRAHGNTQKPAVSQFSPETTCFIPIVTMSAPKGPFRLVTVNTAPERAKRLIGRVADTLKEQYTIIHVDNCESQWNGVIIVV